MFKFITNRPFWVNLVVAIALVCALFTMFFAGLSAMTSHGEIKQVPDVVGKQVSQAVQILESAGLKVEIQDSVFVDSLPRASVIRQSPDADASVKISRTIYLTVNRSVAPLIEMPDLRGFSISSAQLLLSNLGLKLGGTRTVPDIAKNAVKQQIFNNQDIAPGTKLPAGSLIILVLGSGEGSSSVSVPNIVGMTLQTAKQYLSSLHLSIGNITPDADVTDENTAVISSQTPEASSRVASGKTIDVTLSNGGSNNTNQQAHDGDDELEPGLR